MSTPESEYEFSGIIQQSYTAGELTDLSDEAQKMEEEDPPKKRPFRRFGRRRGGPGIFGDSMDP